MKNRLTKIAREVRKELIALAPKFYGVPPKHLGGLCAHASAMLFERFRKEELKVQIASGAGHWFTVCEGFLVDITASQFGQAKICVRDYERVVKKVASQEYSMNWWDVRKLSDSCAAAGLGSNVGEIEEARKDLNG